MKTIHKITLAAAALLAVSSSGVLLGDQADKAVAESPGDQALRSTADVAAKDPQTGAQVHTDTKANVLKVLGEPGKLTVDGQTEPSFEITVHSVKALESCELRGYGTTITPENGTFLLLDVSARLDASAAKTVKEEIALMPLDASVFATSAGPDAALNNQLDTVASYSCALENPLDIAVGAGKEVRGQLMLDSPYATGQVIYDPDQTGGWTWSF
ncbi:hypothetical protein [Glutamicibacter endophyticus]|uniref:hypothetical protein n=1 Tax=Glutamicibacter endophyticus TaxID=1522174 RepID=UPI003AEF9E49